MFWNFYRSKSGSSLYSRILIPDPMSAEDSNKFPGEAVAMGGNILPLEEQFDSRKSLQFHRGIFWDNATIEIGIWLV